MKKLYSELSSKDQDLFDESFKNLDKTFKQMDKTFAETDKIFNSIFKNNKTHIQVVKETVVTTPRHIVIINGNPVLIKELFRKFLDRCRTNLFSWFYK